MNMDSVLGTSLGAILNYRRDPVSTAKDPLIRSILAVVYIRLLSVFINKGLRLRVGLGVQGLGEAFSGLH